MYNGQQQPQQPQQQQQPQQGQQPPQQQQQQSQQGPQQQQHMNNNTGPGVYSQQPYGNSSFANNAPTTSPSSSVAAKGKAGQLTSQGGVGTRKRGASKSPEMESKEKRSRPDDNSTSPSVKNDPNSAKSASSEERVWGEEATK